MTSTGWWDPPPGASFEIAGVGHHRDELARLFPPSEIEPDRNVSAVATLLHEPMNPYDSDAVAVQIEGETVGYIPRGSAPAWADLLARLAAEGLRPRLTAKLWVGHSAWFVRLLARDDARYLTPGEQAAADLARDEAIAARASAREAHGAKPTAGATSVAGLCRDCGRSIERTGQRGRPAVRCADCRGVAASENHPATPRGATSPTTAVPAASKLPRPDIPRDAIPWVAPARPAAWSVIALETTGVFTRFDRIVELGIVRLGYDGAELDAWTTMVNPMRDVGETDVHGLRASDLRGAPTFADIAPELAARVSGSPLVAHNARFAVDFIADGMTRAGIDWPRPDAFCTMVVPHRLGLTRSRRLDTCCAEIGYPYERAHTALSEARAVAAILRWTLQASGGRLPMPDPLPGWPEPPYAIRPRLRGEAPPPRFDTTLGLLADRVGVPAGLGVSEEASLTYLALLDAVLEDRRISEPEVTALIETAERWGIDAASARRLHEGYLAGMWSLARADGVVTAAEMSDLRALSDLLGIPLEEASEIASLALPLHRHDSLVGKTVCFTGSSVCTIGGARLSREDQEALAEQAGLVVLAGVTKGLDILVMADPDSQSGKAQKADRYGTRRMAEAAFWRAVGIGID